MIPKPLKHNRMAKVEILSPAGNMEKLRVAVAYGADAVYMSGLRFGLRAQSSNFTPEEMKEAVEYAHQRGVLCYVTMNILARPEDFSGLDEEILFCREIGVDAIIVSDPGIFSRIRDLWPEAEIHISTQASVTNAEACLFWHRLGAKRVVLARELSLSDIIDIRRRIPSSLELECFVHGAMCVSYSGRCLLSDTFTGRSGNRGNCAQPCRWEYRIAEVKRPDEELTLEHDERGSYILNSKDLCMIEHIPELVKAGINSLKIEGRIKGSFYTAVTTKAYREAVEMYYVDPDHYMFREQWKDLVDRTVHREFGTGFFFDRPDGNAQIFMDKTYHKPAFVVGVVVGYDPENRRAIISARNKIFDGDPLSVLVPYGDETQIIASGLQNEEGEPITSTPTPQMIYSIPVKEALPLYSFLSKDGNKDVSADSREA